MSLFIIFKLFIVGVSTILGAALLTVVLTTNSAAAQVHNETAQNGYVSFDTYIDLETEEFRPSGYQLSNGAIIIKAEINGRVVSAMLDNGADLSLINQALANELGLIASDTLEEIGTPVGVGMSARRVSGVTTSVPGQFSMQTQAYALDLSRLSSLVGQKVEYVIGNDVFSNLTVAFDTVSNLVYFKAPGGVTPPTSTAIEISPGDTIPALVNGTEMRLSIDLGRLNGPLISDSAWIAAGLQQSKSERQLQQDVFGRRSSVDVASGVAVRVGARSSNQDVSKSNGTFACKCDGLVGLSSMAGGGVIIDLRNSMLSVF